MTITLVAPIGEPEPTQEELATSAVTREREQREAFERWLDDQERMQALPDRALGRALLIIANNADIAFLRYRSGIQSRERHPLYAWID